MTHEAATSASSAEVARAIETRIAGVLVGGTYLAVGLIVVGVLGMLAAGIDPLTAVSTGFDLRTVVSDLLALRPEGFLWAGLLTVMALPIGRVVVSGVGFLAVRDRTLALVSLLVLIVVSVSVIAAGGLQL